MQHRIRTLSTAFALVALLCSLANTSAATAAPSGLRSDAAPTDTDVSTPLDPNTFSGPLIVAVPSGREYVVDVKAGDAPGVIDEIQRADRAGQPQRIGRAVDPRAGCGEKIRSLAGMGFWATSVQGCAVAGYNGYWRQYHWQNASDVELCTNGRGYDANHVARWYSTGCTGGYYSVPWGNVLAYTQMQGFSLAAVVGAAYIWWA